MLVSSSTLEKPRGYTLSWNKPYLPFHMEKKIFLKVEPMHFTQSPSYDSASGLLCSITLTRTVNGHNLFVVCVPFVLCC